MKLVCIYQVILPYRVGVYERLGNSSKFDFELLYGKSCVGTKKVNYSGPLNFKHSRIKCFYIPFKTNNGESTLQISPFLFFSLLKRSPDVIFSEGTSNLINASVAFIYAKLFRKKYIWWSLGQLSGRKHKGIRLLMQKWIDYIELKSDAIFTYSTQGENYFLSKRISQEKIFKSINVIDTERKENQIKSLGNNGKNPGFNIVFVGAVIKEKRLEFLLDAVNFLVKKKKDIMLHVIGDGPYLENIKEYALSIGLSNVKFYGKVFDGLSELLLKFNVLVLPGLGGLAIADGMIHSLPIIAGKADGTEWDLIDSSCGFVTSEMSVDYLIEKLDYLYSNPEIVAKMGKASYERIISKFSINHYMNGLFNCIDYVKSKK